MRQLQSHRSGELDKARRFPRWKKAKTRICPVHKRVMTAVDEEIPLFSTGGVRHLRRKSYRCPVIEPSGLRCRKVDTGPTQCFLGGDKAEDGWLDRI